MLVNKNIRKFGSPIIFIVDLNIVMSSISYKAFWATTVYFLNTKAHTIYGLQCQISQSVHTLYNLWLAVSNFSICTYLKHVHINSMKLITNSLIL